MLIMLIIRTTIPYIYIVCSHGSPEGHQEVRESVKGKHDMYITMRNYVRMIRIISIR